MNLKQSFIKKSSAFLLPAALLAVAVPAQAQQQLTQNKVVAPTRQNVTDLGLVSPSEEANVTVFLNMHNKPEFDAAVEALYDPSSPTYRKWMTGPALVKYAPTAAEIQTVQKELEKHGLTILSVDPVGNYAVRLGFDDMHTTGIYSWAFLRDLGLNVERRFQDYLDDLQAKGLDRDKPGMR